MTVRKHDCILKEVWFRDHGYKIIMAHNNIQQDLHPETTATSLTEIEFLDPNKHVKFQGQILKIQMAMSDSINNYQYLIYPILNILETFFQCQDHQSMCKLEMAIEKNHVNNIVYHEVMCNVSSVYYSIRSL